MNRRRHLLTVFGATRRSSATRLFVTPGSAQPNTMRDRNASACADFARRDHRINCARAVSVSTKSAFGRPGRSSSVSPLSRSLANRLRHLSTVVLVTPSSAATRSYTTPGSAHANTIAARTAIRDEPRDHQTSRSRSSSLNTNSVPRSPWTRHEISLLI
jgi:hypothetical protein